MTGEVITDSCMWIQNKLDEMLDEYEEMRRRMQEELAANYEQRAGMSVSEFQKRAERIGKWRCEDCTAENYGKEHLRNKFSVVNETCHENNFQQKWNDFVP